MNHMPIAETPGGGKWNTETPFRPLRIAVLTVSDTRTAETDTSGQLLCDLASREGHIVADRALVQDEPFLIQQRIRTWISSGEIDVIVSTGGTGLSPRDVTPEAVRPLFDKVVEGFETMWHLCCFETVGLSTLQSRACAGISGKTVIFCLPGSNGACRDGWEKIIRWQIDNRHRPCNFSDLIRRLNS